MLIDLGIYGYIEHGYCEPVAEALAGDAQFAKLFMKRAGRGDWADSFIFLKDEQSRLRTRGNYWWKNVFCHERRCKCSNLSGRARGISTIGRRSAWDAYRMQAPD